MSTIYTNAPEVKAVAKAAFPDYNGKKFRVEVKESVDVTYNAYWSGGTKYTYNFIRLDNLQSFGALPSQHPIFDKPIINGDSIPLTKGLVCVEHSYFCGKDMGIRIYVHPDNAPKFLPAPVELSENEKIVLSYVSKYKNSYGGKTNLQFYYANISNGISQENWNIAKNILIEKKLLNKAGSITNEGRNAIQF